MNDASSLEEELFASMLATEAEERLAEVRAVAKKILTSVLIGQTGLTAEDPQLINSMNELMELGE